MIDRSVVMGYAFDETVVFIDAFPLAIVPYLGILGMQASPLPAYAACPVGASSPAHAEVDVFGGAISSNPFLCHFLAILVFGGLGGVKYFLRKSAFLVQKCLFARPGGMKFF